MLTGGARDLPARHQTVRAAVTWSYDLLEPAEQRLFRRLGVFADSFALAAVEVVCAPEGYYESGRLDGMELPAAKSLLKTAGGTAAEPRYCLLETIREYALEQLAGCGPEAITTPARYAHYYLGWLVDSAGALDGDHGTGALAAIRVELANIRDGWLTAASAGHFADSSRTPEGAAGASMTARAASRRAKSSSRWRQRPREARAPRPRRTAGLVLGRLLARQGAFRARQGRLQGAEALLRESLAIMRHLGAPGDCAYALERLGGVVAQRGATPRRAAITRKVSPWPAPTVTPAA